MDQIEYNNSLSFSELENSEKSNLLEALQIILKEHVSQVEEIRRKHPIDAIDLISCKVNQNKSLNHAVKEELSNLHRKIGILIDEVANVIENSAYSNTTLALDKLDLSYNDKSKSSALISADKRKLISIRALNITIDVFNQFNINIESELNKSVMSGDASLEKNLLLANALIYYELTDYMINYISHFSIEGLNELKVIYSEAMKDLETPHKYILKMQEDLNDPNILEDVKQLLRIDIENHSKAIETTKAEWKRIFDESEKYNGEIKKIIDFLPTLKSLRNRAEAQLALLESISVLQLVKNSLGSLQNTASALANFKLAPLDPDRVKRLLNIK